MYSTPPPGAQFSTERRSFAIVVNLSRWRDLNPRPLPYQGSALPLSYIGKNWSGRRGSNSRPSAWKADALSTELLPHFLWAKMDSNHRRRKPADLQSAPFGHSGICPCFSDVYAFRQIICPRNGCKVRHIFFLTKLFLPFFI